jgi:polysaccharide deacetylase family protein (PEP-CTERM system associated)
MINYNILSVDVEEWFHPEALRHLFPQEVWDKQPPRVERNINFLLELFERHQVKATFFTLGWIGRKYPQLVRKIAEAGHEVASHSTLHRMITQLTPEEFRRDLSESIAVLEDATGEPVIGFRAPTFSVVKDTLWAREIMLENSLRYDSSVYPIWHDRYGIADAPRYPYVALEKDGRQLLEFPMPTLRMGNKNFPFGGGGYLRIFPLIFTRYAIKSFNKENYPAIIYMHPWEFDSKQPRIKLNTLQQWRHYYNIKNNGKKLSALLNNFNWRSFKQVINSKDLAELLKKS